MSELQWGHRTPHEWRVLMKKVACYANGLGPRLYGSELAYRQSGSEIASLALSFVREQRKGYVFRDGHVLYYYFLCHACLKTARALQQVGGQDADSQRDVALLAAGEDDDTPLELRESVALAFLERHQCLDAFLTFVKEKKLKGKLKAYGQGFPKYGAEGWDGARIAKALRLDADTIAEYRSQLREFLEDFEIMRERHRKSI